MLKAKTLKKQKTKPIPIKIQLTSNGSKRSALELIFHKTSFSKAPGGDRYEWKEAETVFEVPKDGLFGIKIKASAKNKKQNNSTDDDDLRVALDGFNFGKYERHEEKISWKGFGTSAAWDGASLEGGTKTIYFFADLKEGKHTLQFFADKTPSLKNIEVFGVENNTFECFNLKPDEKIISYRDGIPWMSFIFLGGPPKNVTLEVKTKSGTTKSTKDGDNLKVVVNGIVLKSPTASTASKYKNFYFSGDLREHDTLTIPHQQISHPLAFENSIELWYDEAPEIVNFKINFLTRNDVLKYIKSDDTDLESLKEEVKNNAKWALRFFRFSRKKYSAQFLKHALHDSPDPLIFQSDTPLTQKIRQDPTYAKILERMKEKINSGNLEGEIWPEDFKDYSGMDGAINFSLEDLKTSLHGIWKIEYKAESRGNNQYEVQIIIFDIYDFEKEEVPNFIMHTWSFFKTTIVNNLDQGEILGIIHNYEIEIHLTENIHVD